MFLVPDNYKKQSSASAAHMQPEESIRITAHEPQINYIPRLGCSLNIANTQRTGKVLGQRCWNNGYSIDGRKPASDIWVYEKQTQLEYHCRWRVCIPIARDMHCNKMIRINRFICSTATVHQLINTCNNNYDMTSQDNSLFALSQSFNMLHHNVRSCAWVGHFLTGSSFKSSIYYLQWDFQLAIILSIHFCKKIVRHLFLIFINYLCHVDSFVIL